MGFLSLVNKMSFSVLSLSYSNMLSTRIAMNSSLLLKFPSLWLNCTIISVGDFQRDTLKLQAHLNFCGIKLTDKDLIQKTLSTFPLSSVILANQYPIEVDNKRITTFSKLINLLRVAERHNVVLANNNARAPGKNKIPEDNYDKDNKGKHPKEKRVKNVDSYSHAPYSRGDNNPRGRGQKGHRGRVHWRGGNSNTWYRYVTSVPSGRGNTVEKAHKNPTPKKVENDNAPCYRCGISAHKNPTSNARLVPR
ncbi:uncharacterized protein LOC113316370 [Papaver somniferum]|uniref:uncharacterized protein LOC113316370 n=1 Tax=Papaver somniferum TaxID=3469 RepID=UPI000E703DA6|nr:uncharacterized protein LOC113316370 [Papaver somniferum]